MSTTPAALRQKMKKIQKCLEECKLSKREVAGVKAEDGVIFREPITGLSHRISIWITTVPSVEVINIALVSDYHVRKENIPGMVLLLHQRQQKDCMGTFVIDMQSGQLCWRYDIAWRFEQFTPQAIVGVSMLMVRLGVDLLIDCIDEMSDDEDEVPFIPPPHVIE